MIIPTPPPTRAPAAVALRPPPSMAPSGKPMTDPVTRPAYRDDRKLRYSRSDRSTVTVPFWLGPPLLLRTNMVNEVGVTDRHSPSNRTPEARRTIEVWFPRNVGVSRQRTETVR